MMTFTYKIEGLKELDKALGELPEAAGKQVLRDVGKKALKPVEAAAKRNVTVRTGALKNSINISTRLSPRQAGIKKQDPDKSTVEIYAGGGKGGPHAHLLEFGTAHSAPKPFLRPAWDANSDRVLEIVRKELGAAITSKARQLAAKAGV